jgi:hypothetical protein
MEALLMARPSSKITLKGNASPGGIGLMGMGASSKVRSSSRSLKI